MDSIKGSENRGELFWLHVTEKFASICGNPYHRGYDGIKTMWSKMATDMGSFTSCMKSVLRTNASGTVPEDDFVAAMEEYKSRHTKKAEDLEAEEEVEGKRGKYKKREISFKFLESWKEVSSMARFDPYGKDPKSKPRDLAKKEKRAAAMGLEVTPKKPKVLKEQPLLQAQNLYSKLEGMLETFQTPAANDPAPTFTNLDEIDRLMKILENWEDIFKKNPVAYGAERQESIRSKILEQIQTLQMNPRVRVFGRVAVKEPRTALEKMAQQAPSSSESNKSFQPAQEPEQDFAAADSDSDDSSMLPTSSSVVFKKAPVKSPRKRSEVELLKSPLKKSPPKTPPPSRRSLRNQTPSNHWQTKFQHAERRLQIAEEEGNTEQIRYWKFKVEEIEQAMVNSQQKKTRTA